jgi:protease-4
MEVDSSGGSPAAAEEINSAIKELGKPVITYIRESAASAAYYAITSSDHIFALKNSTVGSIGATASYVENSDQNEQDGLTFVELNTGKYKDSGNPNKKITPDEKNIFMRDLEIIKNNFIQTVSADRGIDTNKVEQIADGSTVLGDEALKLHLIDSIGDYNDVLKYTGSKIGEVAQVCW